ARDRVGGRIHTCRFSSIPVPIELGAEFIHGEPRETMEIVEAAGLAVYEVADSHWLMRGGVLGQAEAFGPELERVFRRMSPASADRSFRQFIDELSKSEETQEAASLALAYVEGFHAANPERISVQSLTRDGQTPESKRQFRILSGYDRVLEWICAGLEPQRSAIHLNTVVRRIEWEPGRVKAAAHSQLDYELEPFVARRAIITLPLGVLKAPADAPGGVRFLPDLKDKREAAARLEMGQVVKVVLCFRERFWEEGLRVKQSDGRLSPMVFLHSPGDDLPTWWTFHPARAPVLTGWAGWPKAEELPLRGERFVIETALDTVARLFGVGRGAVEEQLQSWHMHDWQADPFSRGAYSYVPVGGLDAQKLLAQPVADTLFFAGEATHYEGENGTVAGAIASGKRAAAEVIESLKGE
ncbi:MAG TPA: NAD(P)/FAD-dependent oxidoreductase, partial [Blastocatellia bacterium]|nr:NAD(P)/FAD-dependent oxidoreductase [Blastocatellia bacterium]